MTGTRTLTMAAITALSLSLSAPARAWEPTTTHPGITERAARASKLHQILELRFGLEHGLFSTLTIPLADAPSMFDLLMRLDPTQGYVPDGRGRLRALGWLAAGSVLADFPASHAANHFYDPRTRRGLSAATLRGPGNRMRFKVITRLAREVIPRRGVSAPLWLDQPGNPMGLRNFESQYAKAVRARTPGERSRHLAATLVAAGAVLHVLQDMGSPSHVRNDLAAHLDQIGAGPLDRGSRFERVAALAYGRLGVPAAQGTIRFPDVASFFTNAKKTGLADRTHHRFFSPYTLPHAISLRTREQRRNLDRALSRSLRLPHPAPLPQLKLFAAKSGPVALRDAEGTCLAEYRLRKGVLSWDMSDDCMLTQAAAILPEVAAYSAAMLDYLFRGEMRLLMSRGFVVTGGRFAVKRGTVEYYWDNALGVRTKLGSVQVKSPIAAGKVLAAAKPPPAEAQRIVVLFTGVDGRGNRIVASGASKWPIPQQSTTRMHQ